MISKCRTSLLLIVTLCLCLEVTGCASVKKGMQKAIDSGKTVPRPVRSDFDEALKWGNQKEVERLASEYPNLINPWVEGGKSIHLAIRRYKDETVEHLFSLGIDANGSNFLFTAASKDRTEIARMLLEGGANPNQEGRSGSEYLAPLHYAVGNGNPELVRLLLDAGANPNAKPSPGFSPLHMTMVSTTDKLHSFFGISFPRVDPVLAREVGLALLDVGADPNSKIKETRSTPLHAVQANTDSLLYVALIRHGADIQAKNKAGAKPIHLASLVGCVSAVKILLEHGVDINEKAKKGITPFHYAAIAAKGSIVPVLLANGADLDARNDEGYSPVQVAATFGNKSFLEAVARHGGSSSALRELGRIQSDERIQKMIDSDSGGTGSAAGCRLCGGTGQRMCMSCTGSGSDPSGRTLYCTSCGGSGRSACSHGG